MTIEVIIPNYNGSELISDNLHKVIDAVSSFPDVSITVIDDASRPEEKEKLKSIVQEILKKSPVIIKLVENDHNLGFSGAVNKAAFLASSTHLVLLNSDVAPAKGFLKASIEQFVRDERLFGVGFLDKSIEGGRVVERGRGKAIWKRGLLIHSRGEVDKPDTFWISGGSSMVRRDLFIKLGGFDEIYNPFYWEDIDLSFRARKAGFSLRFEKNSIVIHEHSKGAIKSNFSQFRINTIAYRNQFIFIWKNITDSALFHDHLHWILYHCLRAIARFDGAFLLGILLALMRLPVIIQKRAAQQKYFTKQDSAIISVSLYQ